MHWIKRVEAEHGLPIEALLVAARDQAGYTGTSLPMFAEELGITRRQLQYLCQTLGIRWPRIASARMREQGTAQARRNCAKAARYYATIDGKRDTVTRHARRLGINPSTVLWRIQRWGCTPEYALLAPLVDHRTRAHSPTRPAPAGVAPGTTP